MDKANIRFQCFQEGFSRNVIIAVVSESNVVQSAGSLFAWVPNMEKNIPKAVCWKLRGGHVGDGEKPGMSSEVNTPEGYR